MSNFKIIRTARSFEARAKFPNRAAAQAAKDAMGPRASFLHVSETITVDGPAACLWIVCPIDDERVAAFDELLSTHR